MSPKQDYTVDLLKLLLPTELFEYFDIVNLDVKAKEIHVYLEERNIPPKEFSSEKLVSKGFHKQIKVQDFPIRDKAVFLFIKRRRWIIESTKKIISRDWNLVAKGTRYTETFALFLNKLFGNISNK